jgi:hypothetical protein
MLNRRSNFLAYIPCRHSSPLLTKPDYHVTIYSHDSRSICFGGSNVRTGKPVGEAVSDLSRFERPVARWTIVQGIIALVACIVATVAMVATWIQTLRINEQIEQNNTLRRSRLYSESVLHSTEIHKILIDKPKLRKYVYDGQDIDEKHPDYQEFASLADNILDVFDITLNFQEIKDSRGHKRMA